jgi:hypothetical protein
VEAFREFRYLINGKDSNLIYDNPTSIEWLGNESIISGFVETSTIVSYDIETVTNNFNIH